MKKTIALISALLLLLTSFAGCGSNDPAGTESGSRTDAAAASTTANSPAQSTAPATDNNTPNPPDEPTVTEVKVSSAEELANVIKQINELDLPESVDITLTADIDLTGYTDTLQWEPIYRYCGTFDGAGYTIKNLNWTFIMANDGTTDMPTAENDYSYVLENIGGALGGNCFAKAATCLLILELDGGTVKDLTLADSTLTINCSYNKNYQMFVAGLIGYVNSGTVSGCAIKNVTLTVPDNVNYNQAFLGYAAPLIGWASGNVTLTNCSSDSDCKVDTSANVKFNAATLVGIFDSVDGTLTVTNCTGEAQLSVHPAPSLDGLPYAEADAELGGTAGGLIAQNVLDE